MDQEYFTQKQIDELTKAVSESYYEGMGPTKDKFCAAWDNVEDALTALQAIVGVVPGVSVFAAPAIGIVRSAGAAVAKAVCPKP